MRLITAITLVIWAPLAGAQELQTEAERILYSTAYNGVGKIRQFDLTPAEQAAVIRGLDDSLRGRVPASFKEKESDQAHIEGLMLRIQDRHNDRLADRAAAEPGAKRLPSGLIFKELIPGMGAKPGPEDTVLVHFRGTIVAENRDYANTYRRGRPEEFSLKMVTPCWVEALPKMKVGGSAKFFCKPSLAFGEKGYPPQIPPAQSVSFFVELLAVTPASVPFKQKYDIFPFPWTPPAKEPEAPAGAKDKVLLKKP